MSILPPQSGPFAGTECDDDFWRTASARLATPVKREPAPRTDDASTTWAAFGDYLWLVAANTGKSEKK